MLTRMEASPPKPPPAQTLSDSLLPELWVLVLSYLTPSITEDAISRARCRCVCRAWLAQDPSFIVPMHPGLNAKMRMIWVAEAMRGRLAWFLAALAAAAPHGMTIYDVFIHVNNFMRIKAEHDRWDLTVTFMFVSVGGVVNMWTHGPNVRQWSHLVGTYNTEHLQKSIDIAIADVTMPRQVWAAFQVPHLPPPLPPKKLSTKTPYFGVLSREGMTLLDL